MNALDTLSFVLSLLGIYGLVLSLRYLIPRCFIPRLSAHLNEAQELLNHAEDMNAIPPQSEHRTDLDLLANQFAALRTESNNARGPFQQLWLVIRRGLTCRLYALYDRIEGVKSKLELAIDEERLRLAESTTGTVVLLVHTPAAVTAAPVHNVVDPTVPLPAALP